MALAPRTVTSPPGPRSASPSSPANGWGSASNPDPLDTDLHRAVDRHELIMHFQPVIDLTSGRICGAEALVRWNHPQHGLLPPDDFIGAAERTGTIEAIGGHVIGLAVAAASALRSLGRPGFQMGVNVSAQQLNQPGLDRVIEDACELHGWPPEQLLVEVTETEVDHQPEVARRILNRVRASGALVALDDFGTGYSSFLRLGQMPVDQLKIDRAFVDAIDHRGRQLVRIVDAIVAVAREFGLSLAAEGVESRSQLAYLRSVGCNQAQGYLFSRPVPLSDLADLLQSDPSW